jgi:hypothetical protein
LTVTSSKKDTFLPCPGSSLSDVAGLGDGKVAMGGEKTGLGDPLTWGETELKVFMPAWRKRWLFHIKCSSFYVILQHKTKHLLRHPLSPFTMSHSNSISPSKWGMLKLITKCAFHPMTWHPGNHWRIYIYNFLLATYCKAWINIGGRPRRRTRNRNPFPFCGHRATVKWVTQERKRRCWLTERYDEQMLEAHHTQPRRCTHTHSYTTHTSLICVSCIN